MSVFRKENENHQNVKEKSMKIQLPRSLEYRNSLPKKKKHTNVVRVLDKGEKKLVDL